MGHKIIQTECSVIHNACSTPLICIQLAFIIMGKSFHILRVVASRSTIFNSRQMWPGAERLERAAELEVF